MSRNGSGLVRGLRNSLNYASRSARSSVWEIESFGPKWPSPRLLIEVKPPDSRAFVSEIVHPDRWNRADMFQSFDEANLIHALGVNPHVAVALLVETRSELERAVATGWDRIHLFHGLLDGPTSRWLTECGVSIGAWTPNSREDLLRIGNLGAEMIITDEPELARNLLS